ncbi:MAG: antibiotic biosynthesis monooxygenase [Verrucomicrobiota bacterium]
MKPEQHIFWIVEMTIKPDASSDFKQLIIELVEATQKESGTLNYEWAIAADDQTSHVYERYIDSEAAVLHLRSFQEKFAERFMALVDPTRAVLYGNPSAELTEIMDGFGAEYLAPAGGFAR